MGDVVGRLFHEFAITLAATIVISAFVSLTLVPMMCSKLLRPTPPGRTATPRPAAGSSRGCRASTPRLLNVVLNHQVATLIVALGDFFFTGYLYVAIPKGFFPVQDTGIIQGVTQAAQDDFLRPDGRASAGLGRRRSRIRTSKACPRSSASTAPTSRSIPAVSSSISSRTRSANRPPARSFAVCSRRPPTSPASRCSCSRCRICRSTPPSAPTQYQFTLRKSGSPDVADLDAEGAGAPRRRFRNRRCRERSAAERPFGDRPHRPRDRVAIRHHAGDDRQRALRRLSASASSRPSSPSRTNIASSSTSIPR